MGLGEVNRGAAAHPLEMIDHLLFDVRRPWIGVRRQRGDGLGEVNRGAAANRDHDRLGLPAVR